MYRFGREHWRQRREEGPAGGMTGRGVHVVDAMLHLAGHIESVVAQSDRLAQDFGIDDTTSMLFRFASGATGYLGTVIATAETWRLQVLGSKGWAEVGDVEHLTTWQLRVAYIDRARTSRSSTKPEVLTFAAVSHGARRARALRARGGGSAGRSRSSGGDEVHNVAVLEAILESARSGQRVRVESVE